MRRRWEPIVRAGLAVCARCGEPIEAGAPTGGPVPRFERVEREPPRDRVVIEGDDL
jgi:hypothetical protein